MNVRTRFYLWGSLLALAGVSLLSYGWYLLHALPVSPSAGFSSSTPRYKTVMTTFFFVGEPSSASNAFIPNDVSYWDDQWVRHFGGVDDPEKRCGYQPCGFTPRENPFYVALPYGEFNMASGTQKRSALSVPWFASRADLPLLKNRWVEVKHQGKVCYGQWEDVGPNGEDDFSYVFGSSNKPANVFGAHAGLDISPALWDCLGMTDNALTSWRFVDENALPDGPWKAVITTSGISWSE